MFYLKERTLILDYDPEVRVAPLPHNLLWLKTGVKGCAEQQIRKLSQGMLASYRVSIFEITVTLIVFGIV